MKKVIIGALICALAASVQAGVVSWNATGIKSPDVALTSVDNVYVEFYYVTAGAIDTSTGFETLWGSEVVGTFLKGDNSDSFLATGGARVFNATDGDAGYSIMSQAQAVANRNNNPSALGFVSLYMKLYYSPTVASPGAHTYYGFSKIYTVDVSSIENTGDATFSTLSMSNNGQVTWTPVAVPEPATMALFGLGGLALVLRRKMRKEV